MADTLKSTSERPDWAAEIDDHKILGKIGWLDIDSIARLAIDMKSRAYCRYSNFQVGAGFLIKSAVAEASGHTQTPQTHFIGGCNIESASYPVTTCAERVAIGHAIASGAFSPSPVSLPQGSKDAAGSIRHDTIAAIAVSTNIPKPASPCGMCRQAISEFCHADTPILMLGSGGWGPQESAKWQVATIGELLPYSFGPSDLPQPST